MDISEEHISLLRGAVGAAVTHRADTSPSDLNVVTRLTGQGATTSLAPSHGIRSRMSMLRWLEDECAEFANLKTAQASFPRWIATDYGGAATSLAAIVSFLAERACDSHDGDAVGAVVDRFRNALRNERVTLRASAYLRSHTPPPDDLSIRFSNGVTLRRLEDTELETAALRDVTDDSSVDILSHRCVLERDVEVGLAFQSGLAPRANDDFFEPIERAHAAIHAFKEGSMGISFCTVAPIDPIPVPHRRLGIPQIGPEMFVLTPEEVEPLRAFVDRCLVAPRETLSLAMSRLRDAQLRRSSTDAILDAFIGIEALLNSGDDGELTMRVAMNYATLRPAGEQLASYRYMKALYRARSKVVHGAHRPSKLYELAGVKRPIGELAASSVQLLRNVIHDFLASEKLRGSVKLDAEFWEGRYFGSPAAT